MWKNEKLSKVYDDDTFYKANEISKKYVVPTPLTKLRGLSAKIGKPVYMKDESQQETNSFKVRGVSYTIDRVLNNIDKTDEIIHLVTQSTGNHGIAMMYTLYVIAKNNNKDHIIHKVNPVIFSSCTIQENKLCKMKKYLNLFRNEVEDNERGNIFTNFNSYKEALEFREQYIKCYNAHYIAHASDDTMIGHGTMGIEIKNQLNSLGYGDNVKVCFFASCGAGGPIGIGACLKHIYPFENMKFVIVQTHDQKALISSLINDKIVLNNGCDENMPFNFADGIAVDKPEDAGLNIAKAYADYGIVVNHLKCLMYAKALYRDLLISDCNTNHIVGGTTASTYLAIHELLNDEWLKECDVIIMLGCEGNVDYKIKKYIMDQ